MQGKVWSVLFIAMFLLLTVMPAAAYDYRGVPRPGENNPDTVQEEMSVDSLLSEESAIPLTGDVEDLVNLILMLFIYFLQLFGISTG